MLFYGSKGTICFYFKGLLISSFPLTEKKTVQAYLNQGEELIYNAKGIHIKSQIKMYLQFCNMMYNRKKNNQPIFRSDHINFLCCLTALMRLKIIDNNIEDGDLNGYLNGYMVFQKKK